MQPTIEESIRYWLAFQNCEYTAAGSAVRWRHPGSQALTSFSISLASVLEKQGFTVQLNWLSENDIIPPGQEPFPPLSRSDIKGYRLPVLVMEKKGVDPSSAITFYTSIESIEQAPYPVGSSLKTPSGAADLAASGLSALMAALDHIGDEPLPVSVIVLATSGELGHHGWRSLTALPFLEGNEGASPLIKKTKLAIGIQNVGSCSLVLHDDHRSMRRNSTEILYEKLRESWQANGVVSWSQEPRLAKDAKALDPSLEYLDLSNWFIYAQGIPSALITGGWPKPSGYAGTRDDTLATMCPDSAATIAEFLARAIPSLANWQPPSIPPCERDLVRGCR